MPHRHLRHSCHVLRCARYVPAYRRYRLLFCIACVLFLLCTLLPRFSAPPAVAAYPFPAFTPAFLPFSRLIPAPCRGDALCSACRATACQQPPRRVAPALFYHRRVFPDRRLAAFIPTPTTPLCQLHTCDMTCILRHPTRYMAVFYARTVS